MSQGQIKTDIINKIWRGADPLASFPKDLFAIDMQGWNSTHTYLTHEIEIRRPSVIVEVGVWKGGSTITMAKKLKELQLDAVVIAVDTWLGSWEHWFQNNWFEWLCVDHGRPQLYSKFMANVLAAGVQDYVVPLPIDSINASIILKRFNITPDLVHIDGGHDYHSVSSDLKHWWNVLAAEGTFIGDDYFLDGAWSDVKRAIDDFLGAHPHSHFRQDDGKCRATKLATA